MAIGKLKTYGLPFSNVVATGKATAIVTPGRTLETYRLKLGGTAFTKAMIDWVKIRVNSKPILDATGTQIDKINAYRGIATSAGYLDLLFTDPSMLTDFDRNVGAFDTSLGVGNITAEVKITGATAPTLDPILIEAATQKNAKGDALPYAPLISKLLSYPFNRATGGKLAVTLPYGPKDGAIIKRIHVFHGGNMTGATVKHGGVVVHESVTAENEYDQTSVKRVPQLNVYTIDFVLDGDVRKALDTRDAASMEWIFNFSAADSGDILVEYLDPLGNQ